MEEFVMNFSVDCDINTDDKNEFIKQYGEVLFRDNGVRPNTVSRMCKSGNVYRIEEYDNMCIILTDFLPNN